MLDKIKNAKKESKNIEFKEKFDIDNLQDWCEIIKDVAAIANSGGGVILFGISNNGVPNDWDCGPVLKLDPAIITDKISKYTGDQFSDFNIEKISKHGKRIAVLSIGGVNIPMIFIHPGTYDIGDGRQKTAFAKGTIYFRHGAKSEPGVSKDLRTFVDRAVEKIRKSWLGNIRQVVTAPVDYKVNMLPPDVVESTMANATPIRIVDDPKAPVYRKIDPDNTHPHRQKDVVKHVNKFLGGEKSITPYDIHCIRKVHKIDNSKPALYYKSIFASPQYSHVFIEWLIKKYKEDNLFFTKSRQEIKSIGK